ncbi:MAG: hypothetical protein L7U87_04625 [Chlamydiales bacterium]|nr:hypothetical protein [Chlamydiales bacterium]
MGDGINGDAGKGYGFGDLGDSGDGDKLNEAEQTLKELSETVHTPPVRGHVIGDRFGGPDENTLGSSSSTETAHNQAELELIRNMPTTHNTKEITYEVNFNSASTGSITGPALKEVIDENGLPNSRPD